METKKVSNSAGLKTVLKIGINTRVMLRRNIDINLALVNGSVGNVIGFGKVGTIVKYMMVKFDNVKDVWKIERVMVDFWITKNIKIRRQQFPLCLAYAITIHKSQGLTLECLMTDLGESCFSAAMGYVALSRCKELENVYLIKLFPEKMYCNEVAIQHYNFLRKTIGLVQIKNWNSATKNSYNKRNPSLTFCKNITFQSENVMKIGCNVTYNDPSSIRNVVLRRFINTGVSCYANCVIQSLLQLGSFCSMIQKVNFVYQNVVFAEFVRLCNEDTNNIMSTDLIRSSIGGDFGTNEQQDAHAFFLAVLRFIDCAEVFNIFSFEEMLSGKCVRCNFSLCSNVVKYDLFGICNQGMLEFKDLFPEEKKNNKRKPKCEDYRIRLMT